MSNGELATSSRDIINVMTQFYSDLYLLTNLNNYDIMKYLQNIIPTMTITTEHWDLLEADIMEKEILLVISVLHNNKAPGADGFASEFFKTCKLLLVPHLLKMCNQILRDGLLPPS